MQQYSVTGMSCAACSARVEKAVSKVPGVTACSVSLLTNSMGVEGTADSQRIIAAVKDAGYGASIKGEEKAASIITQHSKGYGMRNVNDRIHLFYGENYGLSVYSEINKGTTITARIPIKRVGETKENSII